LLAAISVAGLTLSNISCHNSIVPLTLGLDEVDCVFPYQEIADDFFGLLRALHEEAKRRDIWKKFRLIVVHSTEVYVPLDMNKSPFNVGLPIELPEFTSQQVQDLARRHSLDWNGGSVEKLMALVGGHPYLLRLAMYAIARQDVTLDSVLQEAPTEAGTLQRPFTTPLMESGKASRVDGGDARGSSRLQPGAVTDSWGI
jgi:hypothetical protein